MTTAKLNQMVNGIFRDIKQDAKADCKGYTLRRRPIEIFGFDSTDTRTEYPVEVDRLSRKEILSFVEQHPNSQYVLAEGGYNAHVTAMWDSDCVPWVTHWYATIWTPETGITFEEPYTEKGPWVCST
jgi:hypothetical protein